MDPRVAATFAYALTITSAFLSMSYTKVDSTLARNGLRLEKDGADARIRSSSDVKKVRIAAAACDGSLSSIQLQHQEGRQNRTLL